MGHVAMGLVGLVAAVVGVVVLLRMVRVPACCGNVALILLGAALMGALLFFHVVWMH